MRDQTEPDVLSVFHGFLLFLHIRQLRTQTRHSINTQLIHSINSIKIELNFQILSPTQTLSLRSPGCPGIQFELTRISSDPTG